MKLTLDIMEAFVRCRYKALLTRLRAGNVICGDEAKIGIRRGVVGYVWVSRP